MQIVSLQVPQKKRKLYHSFIICATMSPMLRNIELQDKLQMEHMFVSFPFFLLLFHLSSVPGVSHVLLSLLIFCILALISCSLPLPAEPILLPLNTRLQLCTQPSIHLLLDSMPNIAIMHFCCFFFLFGSLLVLIFLFGREGLGFCNY